MSWFWKPHIDLFLCSVLAGLYILFVLSVSVWLQLNKNKSKGGKTKVRTSTTTFSDQKFLAIFSFCDNMNYIFTTEHNNQDYMLFLQAMRFITSFCIISGHVMGFSMMTPVLNPYELEKVNHKMISSDLIICLF